MRSIELWQLADAWILLTAIAIPTIGKVVITCVALRGARPGDRPTIISAVADLYRWRYRTTCAYASLPAHPVAGADNTAAHPTGGLDQEKVPHDRGVG
jgi:hypothetical protein